MENFKFNSYKNEDIFINGKLSDLKLKKEPNTIIFNLGKGDEPILLLKENGDIFVKGKLIENDKEIVDAMREFLKYSGFIK